MHRRSNFLLVTWAFALVLPALLVACSTSEGSRASVSPPERPADEASLARTATVVSKNSDAPAPLPEGTPPTIAEATGVPPAELATQTATTQEPALPDFLRNGSAEKREAYSIAVANPEVLSQYPCYCGCDALGHKSNLDCYIREVRVDGSIVFDDHAFG